MKIKKIRFNAIDFLILLVIFAAAFTAIYRSSLKDSLVAIRSNETIEYTVKIGNVQKASFDMIESDDSIFSKTDDKLLGVVVGKRFEPAQYYIELNDGTIVKTQEPDRVDIYLTIEAKGRVSDDGCMIGGNYFIAAGKYISAYTRKVSFNFEVIDAYKKT